MTFAASRNKSRAAAKLAAVVLFCLFTLLPAGVFGATPAEYRTKLISAQTATNRLLVYAGEILDESRAADAGFERQMLAELRSALPATEKVEWDGTVVETGNQWLEPKLRAFEEATGDWRKRRLILAEIGERLAALERKIVELEGVSAAARSKDEDKRKLAEILRRLEYQKPEAQEKSWFERLQERIKKWFDEKMPNPQPVPETAGSGLQALSVGLQILLYVLILGFIGFLIYRFAPFFAGRFRRREREDGGERVILGEKLAAHENAQTLFDEAEALARTGNLRGAIRKGYIAMLCELSDRKIIGLAQHKTNRDYLRDVRKKRVLYESMHGLTNQFERHWYGFETADETDWQEFREIYQKAVSEKH